VIKRTAKRATKRATERATERATDHTSKRIAPASQLLSNEPRIVISTQKKKRTSALPSANASMRPSELETEHVSHTSYKFAQKKKPSAVRAHCTSLDATERIIAALLECRIPKSASESVHLIASEVCVVRIDMKSLGLS
jgi:hypothetical protein